MLCPEHDGRCVAGFPAWHGVLAATLIVWGVTWGVTDALAADPSGPPTRPQDAIRDALSRAGKQVDEAWEVFHHAALGGTLTSPAIQATIEHALHESRRLFAAAREAAQNNDPQAVFAFTRQIEALTAQIILDSRMRKP